MDPRNYNKLDPSIHKISSSMSLNEDRRKMVNAQLSGLLESLLLPAMKEVDEDFKNLFQRLHYSGSYYENLRISEPNEFDLNLELRSQKGSQKFFQVHYTKEYPGFVQIKHISGDTVKKWVNGNGFVMQHKVLSWLQGVVDKALKKISDGPWHKTHSHARRRHYRGRRVTASPANQLPSPFAPRHHIPDHGASARPVPQPPFHEMPSHHFPGHADIAFVNPETPHSHARRRRYRRRRVAASSANELPTPWGHRQHIPERGTQVVGTTPVRTPSRCFVGGSGPSSSRTSLPPQSRFAAERRGRRCFPRLRKLRRSMSGPAVTLYAEYVPGEVFSIDLVPVFVLDPSQWPRLPVRQPVIRNNAYAEQWCVVPKPNNHVDGNGNIGTFWRMSFYNQEKAILNNKNHLKNALKLMKLLRDKEGWHSLSSYYLKTVYLWTLTETDSHYWNSGIGVVFMHMLKTLRDYLKDRQLIPFFWDRQLNVLSSVDLYEIRKIGFRLDRIIRDIDRNLNDNNPTYIEDLFAVSNRSRNSSPEESPTESLQQGNSFGWESIAVGIGVLAIGGALLARAFGNNRD